MTDKKKTAADEAANPGAKLAAKMEAARQEKIKAGKGELNPDELITPATLDGSITFAGDPLHLDPDTGDILTGEMTEAQREKLQEVAKKIINSSAIENATASIVATIQRIKDSFISDETRELLQEIRDDLQPLQDLLEEIDRLEPYIKAELKKGDYDGRTFDSILHEYTPRELLELRRDPDSYFSQLLEAARAAAAQEIVPYKADALDIATDKINLFAWDLRDTDGQLRFDLSKDGTDDKATALFSLTFDDDPGIQFTKEIDHYDKRIQSVIGTAWNDDSFKFTEKGTKVLTLTGIFRNMGNTARPNARQLKKIADSLTKQGSARLFVDTSREAEKYKYPPFIYDDALLHFRRITAEVDGKITDAAIEILAEPALTQFARERKQISAVPIEVLQSPVSQTKNNLRIDDYLQWRIVRQKRTINKLQEQQKKKYTQNRQKLLREARQLTILLKTFYDQTGNGKKDTTGKKRALKTAGDYLKHYQSEAAGKWITDYKIEPDRIVITLPIE